MKKIFGCMFAVILAIGGMGFSGSNTLGLTECIAADLGPFISIATPMVKMSKKSAVVIMGTGFKPGQPVNILIATPDGLQSDIGYALKPKPVPDKTGSWVTTWQAGHYVSKKLVKGGACKIAVADEEYNLIAHAVVFFQEEKSDKKK